MKKIITCGIIFILLLCGCIGDSDNVSDESQTKTLHNGNSSLTGSDSSPNENPTEQLPKEIEEKIGTDPALDDTDGDGLSDYFELMELGLFTDPTVSDTDGDGVSDAMEDIEGDGLTNLREQGLGTDPLKNDTDSDLLSDGFEVNTFGSNPCQSDSDEDGLTDYKENLFGTDPLRKDSDADGFLDGEESYPLTVSDAVFDVGLTMNIRGGEDFKAWFMNCSYVGVNECPAVVLQAIDVMAEGEFADAILEFGPSYSNNLGGNGNLAVYYFDEAVGTFVRMDSEYAKGSFVRTHVNMSGTYAVLDEEVWKRLWE